MNAYRLASLLLLIGIALAACSGSSGPADEPPPPRDTSAPTVVDVAPVGTTVNSVAPVVITFSEPMNTGSTAVTILPTHDLGTKAWSNGDRTLTYTPPTRLAYGTTFTLLASGKDVAGNALAGLSTFQFTVRDEPAIAASPYDGETDVARRTTVALTFEDVMPPTPPAVDATDGVQAFALGVGAWSGGGRVLTFTPPAFFGFAKTYTVTITGAVSAAGEPYAPAAFAFTTGPQPAVVASDPQPASTGIPPGSAISVTFNVEMNPTTARNAFTGVTCGSRTWSAGNTVLTCVPSPALAVNSTYQFQVGTGATSVHGDAISPQYVATFATVTQDVTPPDLLSVDPASGSTTVYPGGGITFTFSERMDESATEGALTVLAGPSGGTVTGRPGTFGAWNSAGTIVTWTPTVAFARSEQVSWTLAANAAKDLAGNFLPAHGGGFHVVKGRVQELPAVMSQVGTLRLSVSSYSKVPDETCAGDDLTNAKLRSYWSFDLGALAPLPARITTATLAWTRAGTGGAPAGLGTLYANSVAYGATLDASAGDWGVTPDTRLVCSGQVCSNQPIREALSPAATSGWVDVTTKVAYDLARWSTRAGRSQFQVAFTTASDADGTGDWVCFTLTTTAGTRSPKLTVEYDYGW